MKRIELLAAAIRKLLAAMKVKGTECRGYAEISASQDELWTILGNPVCTAVSEEFGSLPPKWRVMLQRLYVNLAQGSAFRYYTESDLHAEFFNEVLVCISPKETETDETGEFCYRMWKLGKKWSLIVELGKKKYEREWTLNSPTAVFQCADRYAKRKGRPRPLKKNKR